MSPHDVDQDDVQGKPALHKKLGRWLAVYESILDHPILGMPKDEPWTIRDVWQWMMFQATHRNYAYDVSGRVVHLSRGQFVLSERHLARKANWTRKKAASWLAKLARNGMIETVTTRPEGQLILDFVGPKRGPLKGPPLTIVTICNYNKYQHPPRPEGATLGATKGPPGRHYPTSTTDKIVQESHQSPMSSITKEDQSAGANATAGTDRTDVGSNVVPIRRSMMMDAPGVPFVVPAKTLQSIEALGCDPEELVDRMNEQIDKGRRIGSKSRYLITSALNEAHERDGTPIEVLKALISGNKFARQAALIAAAAQPVRAKASPENKALHERTTAHKINGAALLAALTRK